MLALGICAVLTVGTFVALTILVPPGAGQRRQLNEAVVSFGTAALFAVLLAQLAVAATAWPERRRPTLVVAAGLLLWGVGSTSATAVQGADTLDFPAPGEGFFLASYACLAVFLVIDAGHERIGLRAALEAVVICGGGASLAATLLLSPVAAEIDARGVDALLAMLYPVLDLLLALVVLADLALGRRRWTPANVSLLAGFVVLGVADATWVRLIAADRYDFGPGMAVLWSAGLALVASGACGPRPERRPDDVRLAAAAPVVAAFVAMVVLTLSPPGWEGAYLSAPALVTLTAAGARLGVALREARAAAEAFRLSLTDDLTGLPNRRALLDRVQAAIREQGPLGVLLADLDGFKELNDTLGHAAGDVVLAELGRRLRAGLPAGVLVARLGGDEFALAVPDRDPAALRRTAERVRRLVGEPLGVEGHAFAIGASVGIAPCAAGSTSSDLLRHADIAMYQAKGTREGIALYDPSTDRFTTERLRTVEQLRVAIPDGQLRVHYQPQVDAGTLAPAGLEALVRWQHPERGLLSPADVLPVARRSGLMPAVTAAVAEIVLEDARQWLRQGVPVRISFNVAPPELLNEPLLDQLLAAIDRAALPPGALALEVTEDSFLADHDRARSALLRIGRHHVQVAVDDYGSGFSSLAYLRDLPVHELKLDRSFVLGVEDDERSRIIVASTTRMARGLGLRTVAEGVETRESATVLRSLGVDLLQGYHVARPMPAAEVRPWLAEWAAATGAPAAFSA